MASAPITSWQIEGGKVEVVTNFLFLGSKITVDGDCSHEIRRRLLLARKAMTNLDNMLRSRDITLDDKGPYSQGYGLPSGHVWLWELDRKEGGVPKNWCLWNCDAGQDSLEFLDGTEIKSVNLKRNQPWILIGRTDAEALVFWSSDANSWLIGTVRDKDWGQEKRAPEDEMAGWHQQCNGHELGQT